MDDNFNCLRNKYPTLRLNDFIFNDSRPMQSLSVDYIESQGLKLRDNESYIVAVADIHNPSIRKLIVVKYSAKENNFDFSSIDTICCSIYGVSMQSIDEFLDGIKNNKDHECEWEYGKYGYDRFLDIDDFMEILDCYKVSQKKNQISILTFLVKTKNGDFKVLNYYHTDEFGETRNQHLKSLLEKNITSKAVFIDKSSDNYAVFDKNNIDKIFVNPIHILEPSDEPFYSNSNTNDVATPSTSTQLLERNTLNRYDCITLEWIVPSLK